MIWCSLIYEYDFIALEEFIHEPCMILKMEIYAGS